MSYFFDSIKQFTGQRDLTNKADAKNMKFKLSPSSPPKYDIDEAMEVASSDFNQWLHAMKMVARLPGGMPPEFRRKLWLALADKYLQTRNVNWTMEQAKCFSEQWREDDEELGTQIVKDLHRTGSSLCSGPTGTINQAKLKRILLGYARWNPEVGYCQGFNMLGALILQVMDKNEDESMKVMIFLVEGVLPSGYFSGSLGGLQADMAVFRELMTSKLPKLAKHLQRLQGPIGEGSFEPPLTNVFTMQWFLTLFCTCLPISCVFRVWDLALIEGSDVLLRTALAIWSLLEGKILTTKTADDFYCRMGTLSGELLNSHLVDSNGLIEKVVELGPIPELQKLRDKHLYNIAPWQDKKGLRLFYSDDEGESDDDSRLAVTAAWGLRLNRRGSSGPSTSSSNKPVVESKDRIALDISLLKKQYDRLRERQKQAHIILTSAVARQGSHVTAPTQSLQMNQLLLGRSAIITNKGRRIGPPQGAIPPARKLPPSKPLKSSLAKQSKRGETLHWHDTEAAIRRKSSITLTDSSSQGDTGESSKHLLEVAASSKSSGSEKSTPSSRSRKKSESSSYSEDSDANSSTSTSLCDEDDIDNFSSLEASPHRKKNTSPPPATNPLPDNEVPDIVFMNLDKSDLSGDVPGITKSASLENLIKFVEIVDEDSSTECDRLGSNKLMELIKETKTTTTATNSASSSYLAYISPIDKPVDYLDVSRSPMGITSTSQLSPIADISTYLSTSSISPLKTPSSTFNYTDLIASKSEEAALPDTDDSFDISEEGVLNEYFERVNLVERPTKLDLFYSLNDSANFRAEPVTKIQLDGSKPYNPAMEDDDNRNDEDSQRQVIGISENRSLHASSKNSPNIHCTIRPLELASLNSPSRSISKSPLSPIRNHIVKEKSFSFDDATIIEKQESRPRSCPEARADLVDGKLRTDRVLKIIEENSMILHRILKKNIADVSPVESNIPLEQLNKDEDSCYSELRPENLSPDCSANSIKNDISSQPEVESENAVKDLLPTPTRSRNEVPLKYEDNIADRLASIKNTIKSIDSLCDDRTSYKKDKCQKYIDALFEQKSATPSIQIVEPSSDYNFNEEYGTELAAFSSRSRYSRDYKRDLSPRRRFDEDREEYESRTRRDQFPTFITSTSMTESIRKNNNKSPVRCNIEDVDYDGSNAYTPTKIEIRHTTVTSTLYDRYLSQKQERDAKIDRSPPSPVITKSYLDSLKPTTPIANRYAKSAENSPSREKFVTSMLKLSPSPTTDFSKDVQIRSCDNILLRLRNCSNTTSIGTSQPYSPLSSPKSFKSLIAVGSHKSPFDEPETQS